MLLLSVYTLHVIIIGGETTHRRCMVSPPRPMLRVEVDGV